MFKKSISRVIILLSLTHGLSYAHALPNKGEKIVVFTDYEADDCVAIALLLQYIQQHDIRHIDDLITIGVSLSNQYRKQALVQDMLKRFDYNDTGVFAGTGGIKEPFEEEGRTLLAEDVLHRLSLLDQSYSTCLDPLAHQDNASIVQFKTVLESAADNAVDVIILTNPIDFVTALNGDIKLLRKIRVVYMMGGFFAGKPSYNWSIYPDSIIEFLQLMEQTKDDSHAPKVVLFSSHMFAREFNGYVNYHKFSSVIQAFDTNNHPVVAHMRAMVKNWDDSMTVIKDSHSENEKAWRLEMIERIGKENIGRQFAPADPATMLGYLYPTEFVLRSEPVSIAVHVAFNNGKKLVTVDYQHDMSSNIYLAETVNLSFFSEKLTALMEI